MSEDHGNNGVNAGHLRAFIERIELLETEKKAIADDIKEVYAEAKSSGFDAKMIRKIVSIRKMDAHKRREEEEILDLYLSALGMLGDTPLGRSAVERAAADFRRTIPEGMSVTITARADDEAMDKVAKTVFGALRS